MNDRIPNAEMMIIDANGTKLGVFGKAAALAMANAKGYDIVIVSPDAKPMIAKLMDYSKFKYEQKKKFKEMRKNQQVSDIKEIQLSPTIQKHDIETKLRQSRNFIEDGDKVKIVMRLRGRMIEHKDIGRAVIENFISMMSDIAVVEKKLVLEERSFYVTLTKKK